MPAAATPRRLSQAGSNPGTPRGRRLSKANSDPPSPKPRQKVSSPGNNGGGALSSRALVDSTLVDSKVQPKLGLLSCQPDEAGLDVKALEEHRQRNRWQASLGVLPGVAECVIAGDRIAYLDLMGSADVERGTPVKLTTLFRCFSMTKPITAIALMRLVEAKQVGLDDPVHKYIPSFQSINVVKPEHAKEWHLQPEHLEPVRTAITLRHLLTHTSGLGYGPDRVGPREPLKAGSAEESSYLPLVKAVDNGSIRSLAEFCDSLAKLPLRFQPGSRWLYSHGVDVVGRVIEVVSGRPLDVFLREEVFHPLGMTRTNFFVDQNRARDLAAMYLAKEEKSGEEQSFVGASLRRVDGRQPQESRWCNRRRRVLAGGGIMGSCGGGLVSCLHDMALFVSMLANQGKTNSGTQLLQPSTMRALWRDWLALASVVGHRQGRKKRLPGWYGGARIGWNPLGHVRHKDKCLYMGGWSTSWAIYPKTRLATISMSQSLVYFDIPGWVARKDELDSAVEFGVANHRRRKSQILRHRQIRRAAKEAGKQGANAKRSWKLKMGTHALSRALRKGALRAVVNQRSKGANDAGAAAGTKASPTRRRSGAHTTPAEPQPKRRRST